MNLVLTVFYTELVFRYIFLNGYLPNVVKSVGECAKTDADRGEPPTEQICPVNQAVRDCYYNSGN